MSPLLEAIDLRKTFGGITALGGCSVSVTDGSLVGIIGPNGSGKTTLLNAVTGYVRADSGRIIFGGAEIRRPDPSWLYRKGLGRTFQQARIFPELTVIQNLAIGRRRAWQGFLRRPLNSHERSRAEDVLERFGLSRLARLPAEECSYGQRRLLEFASLLMSDPRLVLLDEPTAGVNPVMADELERHILRLYSEGVTFVIVEHNLEFLMRLCNRIVVLDHGVIIADGEPLAVRSDRRVLDAYLGA